MILSGTPCQDLSRAGKQAGLNGDKSKLFYVFLEVLKFTQSVNPKVKFLFENVASMKEEDKNSITECLEVYPVRINSKLVSAHGRDRLYWTNMPILGQPKDKKIFLKDIIESGDVDRDKSFCLDANYFKGTNAKGYLTKNRRQVVWEIPEATKKGFIEVSEGCFVDLTFIKSETRRGRLMIEKSNCLTAPPQTLCKVTKDWFRKLTPEECEKLQTLQPGYTSPIPDNQRYKALGNGWTVDVIIHLLQNYSAETQPYYPAMQSRLFQDNYV